MLAIANRLPGIPRHFLEQSRLPQTRPGDSRSASRTAVSPCQLRSGTSIMSASSIAGNARIRYPPGKDTDFSRVEKSFLRVNLLPKRGKLYYTLRLPEQPPNFCSRACAGMGLTPCTLPAGCCTQPAGPPGRRLDPLGQVPRGKGANEPMSGESCFASRHRRRPGRARLHGGPGLAPGLRGLRGGRRRAGARDLETTQPDLITLDVVLPGHGRARDPRRAQESACPTCRW